MALRVNNNELMLPSFQNRSNNIYHCVDARKGTIHQMSNVMNL